MVISNSNLHGHFVLHFSDFRAVNRQSFVIFSNVSGSFGKSVIGSNIHDIEM